MRRILLLPALLSLVACAKTEPQSPDTTSHVPTAPSVATAAPAASLAVTNYDRLDRATFNQRAVRLNLPLYWREDTNKNGAVDPSEVASLLFYPSAGAWTQAGSFTPAFAEAYEKLLSADKLPEPADEAERARQKAVLAELDAASPLLVYNDLSKLSDEEKTFAGNMLKVAELIDKLYAKQSGADLLQAKVSVDDLASQSLFRRNWGPSCQTPSQDKNKDCSAIAGAPKQPVDVYPASLQQSDKFCEEIEKNPQAKQLLEPFVVVREKGGKLSAVPYNEAYKSEITAIADQLKATAAAIQSPKETPLKTYLLAAAQSFLTNDWKPADEAWAKMNAENSAWYVRVAPDETYWEPCSHKAGFHLTFARINTDSLKWQEKLKPVQQDMEDVLAKHIGAPYKARKVTFHLPDFIDIVVNAGDDRDAVGATIGQSLPNWGPVANEGRGRTVAMSNLYTDPDSMTVRRSKAESLFINDAELLSHFGNDTEPSLLSTILHEASHNLGPAHQYEYKGKSAEAAFGGDLASMMEELKAQSGSLWFVAFAQKRGIITPEQAKRVYTDSLFWAMNHISRGMWTADHKRKPYSQLAAVQVGFLMDEKALTFDPNAPAANGSDKGAFSIDFEKLPVAIDKLMKKVGSLKASNDRAGAEALAKRYVDGDIVPHKVIAERLLRFPQPNFVYAIEGLSVFRTSCALSQAHDVRLVTHLLAQDIEPLLILLIVLDTF